MLSYGLPLSNISHMVASRKPMIRIKKERHVCHKDANQELAENDANDKSGNHTESNGNKPHTNSSNGSNTETHSQG